jgi:hypothetical protein
MSIYIHPSFHPFLCPIFRPPIHQFIRHCKNRDDGTSCLVFSFSRDQCQGDLLAIRFTNWLPFDATIVTDSTLQPMLQCDIWTGIEISRSLVLHSISLWNTIHNARTEQVNLAVRPCPRIREAPCSNLDRDSSHPYWSFSRFTSFTPGKMKISPQSGTCDFQLLICECRSICIQSYNIMSSTEAVVVVKGLATAQQWERFLCSSRHCSLDLLYE